MLCIVYNNVCWNFVYVGYYCSHSLRGLCGLKCPMTEQNQDMIRHSLRGLCGLKSIAFALTLSVSRHSLRGLCGLKSIGARIELNIFPSQPARAVWIEIFNFTAAAVTVRKSQPARAVWIEIQFTWGMECAMPSQPARAVWIEISSCMARLVSACGHSLRGLCGLKFRIIIVIHPGYVSHSLRGLCGLKFPISSLVTINSKSQPARAVWIEILPGLRCCL